jgi:ssDNA-binding Zn-finger/Zn-ribbon topoisomerase 1
VFYGCSRYPDCEYTTWTRPRPPGESADQAAAEDKDGDPPVSGASTDRTEAEDGGDTAELAEVSPPDTAAG